MTRDTNSTGICTLFFKCIMSFDTLVREMRNRRNNLKDNFPLEADIWACRQEFQQWAIRYGANLDPSSMISPDYKFRNHDYTRSTIVTQLGHLFDDLKGLQELRKGQKDGSDAKAIFNRVKSVVAELIRFLGHLPKELWLEPEK
ncbi:hypothetical protein FSARC_12166 [Fusarium sarcochroum]|uniref:Uncharacterized protein n=1 Tax=Fusarium sarcochroum TaxID=1208366 RepID=A0A8H4WXQ7_9HYPO|nr:hypothetical protein FSARC_12166 [Fusarium sarcochroum]